MLSLARDVCVLHDSKAASGVAVLDSPRLISCEDKVGPTEFVIVAIARLGRCQTVTTKGNSMARSDETSVALESPASRRQKRGRSLPKGNFELAAALRSSIFKLERNIRRQSRSRGRSAIELHVLQTLEQNPGVTQSHLAALEQISRASMGAHIRKLVALGYIRASAGDTSKAGSPIELNITRLGRAFLQRSEGPRKDWLTQQLERLKSDDHKQLVRALDSFQLLVAEAPTD